MSFWIWLLNSIILRNSYQEIRFVPVVFTTSDPTAVRKIESEINELYQSGWRINQIFERENGILYEFGRWVKPTE